MKDIQRLISGVLIYAITIGGVGVALPLDALAAFSAITTRGSAVTGTGNNSSISVSPTANITVGKVAFFAVVTDNQSTTDGCDGALHTLSGSAGNTWMKLLECTETDGVSDDGVTVSLFYTKVATQISTTDSVTVSFQSSRSDIIGMLFEVTVGAGNTVNLEQLGTGVASLSASVSGMTSREYLLIGHSGSEGEDNAKTPDADYLERFDLITTTSGVLDSNIAAHVQTRIATLTSDTVTSTAWTNTNPITTLSALYEVTLVAPTIATDAASNVADTTATLNATISATGYEDAKERGFAYSTVSTLSSGVSTSTLGAFTGTGSFSENLSSLTPGQTYYFRAYATNNGGTGYGTIKSFTATAPDVPAAAVGQPRFLRMGTMLLLRGTLIIR